MAGFLCLLAFAGISTVQGGFHIDFHGPFNHIPPGEANLWLSTVYLLFPACCLLGYGFRDPLVRGLRWLRDRLAALSVRQLALALGVLAIVSARLCNSLVLLGYPITDDEWAARFGGEVLADGKLLVRLPFLKDAFPLLFMFVERGRLTSFDWLGTQIPWAIAKLTHTGNLIFALEAALPVPCLFVLFDKRVGRSWAVAAAALFMLSPMAFALSMSTHGHLASRGLITLVLALHVLDHPSRALAFAKGLALGAAIICRPFETCFLLAPLFVFDAWETLRNGDRVRWGLFALGVALPVALFFAHAYALTGSWVPPRHHPSSVSQPIVEPSLWMRFGSNSAFNALRLAVWFAGPLGVLLFAAGVLTDRFTGLLSLGLLSALLLGLFHDNYGVHLVGPIHYSECVVPLTIVAVHGLHRISHGWRRVGFAEELPLAISAVWLTLGLGTFSVLQGYALHQQTLTQAKVYERIEELIPADQRPAILFAPTFSQIWGEQTAFTERGSWVFEWRRPKSDFSDDILILHGSSGPAIGTVRTAYPGRHVFFLHRGGQDKPFRISVDP